jgi:hypothetical protein
LSVSFDRTRSAALDFVDDRTMPGAHVFVGVSALGGTFGAKFARMPGQGRDVRGLPNLTLVGPDGTVVAILHASGEGNLLNLLEGHLA